MSRLVNMVELCIITKRRFTEWIQAKDAKDPRFIMGLQCAPTGRTVKIKWKDQDDTLPARCNVEAERTGQRPLTDEALSKLTPTAMLTNEELKKLMEK